MSINTPDTALDEAAALHDRMVSFDSHIDIPLEFGSPGRGAFEDGPDQFDLVKAARGRLSGAALSIHATLARPGEASREAGRREHQRRWELITGIARDNPEHAQIVRSPDEVRAAASAGRFAIMLSLQNTEPLADLEALDQWRARGVRMVGFSFIGNNRWADSARPYPFIGQGLENDGLSALGQAAVRRLNELGVIVDVSQISSAALRDVLAASNAPVIASHSLPRAFVDIDRNLTDQEMQAIAARGGVVQVVGFAPYIVPPDDEMLAKLGTVWSRYGLAAPDNLADFLSLNDPSTASWREDTFWEFLHVFHEVLDLEHPVAAVGDYVDAVAHAIGVVGIDHVGIGSDFNHASGVLGWMNVGENLNVTAELLRRGFPDEQIAKLWGGNFLRVWQQIHDGAGG